MHQLLRLLLLLDLILLSLTGMIAQDVYQPSILSVKQDDRVATLFWNSKMDTYQANYDPDKQKGIYSYLVEWGTVEEGFIHREVTPYRSFMVQPLEPGKIYQARIYNIDVYGKLSVPSAAVSFQHSSARVEVMRAKLNGFFDDFNRSMGPFSERDWNQAYSGCMEVGSASQHINDQYHAHNVIKSGACDRGVASSRLRHVFDFTGRTGTIEFDTDGSKLGRQFWYLDLTPANRKRDLSGHTSLDNTEEDPGADPAYLLRFQETGDRFTIALANDEGKLLLLPNQYQNGACGAALEFCSGENLTPVPNVRRRYRILLSKTRVQAFINDVLVVDASLQTGYTPEGLPYEEAQINWLFFSYNTTKENIPAAMIHWDNFGIDAPFGYQQETVIHNYTDGELGTSVARTGNDPSAGMVGRLTAPATTTVPIPDPLKDVGGNDPLKAELMFTIQGGEYEWTAQDEVLLNGNTYALPKPSSNVSAISQDLLVNSFKPFSVVLDIDPSELVQGDNQLSFSLNNGRVLNVHIELSFPKDQDPAYTEPMEIFSSYMQDLMAFKQNISVGPGILFSQVNAIEVWQDEFQEILDTDGKLVALKKQLPVEGASLPVVISANSMAQLASTGHAKGITHYEILLNGEVIETVRVDEEHPVAAFMHESTVDISGLPNGEHELFVRAYDIEGTLSVADYFLANAYPVRPIPIRFTVTGSTVSVSPSLESEIEIFPNPTEGKVVLKNPGRMFIESLSVYDIQGRLLRQDALTSGVSEIAVEIQGETGIYLLRVETKDHGIFTAKLVKQ